jgi:hypothetical protein
MMSIAMFTSSGMLWSIQFAFRATRNCVFKVFAKGAADPGLSFFQAGQAECSLLIAFLVRDGLHPEAACLFSGLLQFTLLPQPFQEPYWGKGACG